MNVKGVSFIKCERGELRHAYSVFGHDSWIVNTTSRGEE
jgi:hypothetical protein